MSGWFRFESLSQNVKRKHSSEEISLSIRRVYCKCVNNLLSGDLHPPFYCLQNNKLTNTVTA
jgi:hypothetical protein